MRLTAKILAAFLILTSITPMQLLMLPQKAEAAWPTFDAANVLQTTITAIKSTISAVAEVATQINSWMLVVKHWVLDPLAFILSGNMLRSLTAGVIDFVNGKTNGVGSPQFVRSLQGHLLGVGDTRAFRFFSEYGMYSNSPFSGTILSSLRSNYLQGTSRAGFWAANRCTLTTLSPNINAFLRGNFNQGGWVTWFSLTGDPRNNPYSQYYIAQAELSATVREGTANALSELGWGDGFMSWCGDVGSGNSGSSGFACPQGQVWNAAFQTCSPASIAGATQGSCPAGQVWNASFQTCTSGSIAGATNGNCTKSDGTPGLIQTPGSVIRDGLEKALGTNIDKAVEMGDASADINAIFSNFASIMQTMSYGTAILGSVGGAGLFGANPSTASIGSAASVNSAFSASRATHATQALAQAQNEGSAGVIALQSTVASSGGGGGGGGGSVSYAADWTTIKNAAVATKNQLEVITNTCPGMYFASAFQALANTVNPLVTTADTEIANTAPTPAQATYATTNAQVTGAATTPKCGSFTATGGTLVDQMKVIQASAVKAASVCGSGSIIIAMSVCPL